MRFRWLRAGVSAVLLSGFVPALPAAAQEPDAEATGPACNASTRSSDGNLVVVCGETGFLLGHPIRYSLVALPSQEGTIVDTAYGDDRRLWLVTSLGGGEFVLEEISGAIASAAGRGTTLNLAGVSIDLEPASSGRAIAVSKSDSSDKALSVSVDISALAAQTRQARSDAATVSAQETGGAQ